MKYSILFALLLTSGLVQANNLLVNGDFEGSVPLIPNHGDPDSMGLSGGSTYIPGWRVTGPEVAWIGGGNNYGLSASSGNRFLDLTGWVNTNGNQGGVTQTINTIAGQRYTLSFDLGNSVRHNYGNTSSLTAFAGNQSQLFFNTDTSGSNSWQHFSFDFVANGSQTDIAFVGNTAVYYIGLDNVAVTAAVPEAETWGMLLAGLGALAWTARRRQARG